MYINKIIEPIFTNPDIFANEYIKYEQELTNCEDSNLKNKKCLSIKRYYFMQNLQNIYFKDKQKNSIEMGKFNDLVRNKYPNCFKNKKDKSRMVIFAECAINKYQGIVDNDISIREYNDFGIDKVVEILDYFLINGYMESDSPLCYYNPTIEYKNKILNIL